MVSQVMHRLRSVVPQRTINLDHPNNLDHKAAYTAHVDSLKRSGDYDKAMRTSIGGEFAAMGVMMRELLIMHGLTPGSDVIDVGCGAGRLTTPLSTYLDGHYLGIDVVDELVEYARREAARPDWHFRVTSGLDIPAPSNSADMVCFFSVFTHLLHEESYRYLHEAKRVLRPGGRIVFSFLEFSIPSHWLVFDLNLATVGQPRHHNQFMSRDGITKWAQELGLEVVAMYDGDKPHIPLPHPVELESGMRYEGLGTLGQSVCVLQA